MNEKENLKVFGNEQLKKDYIDRTLTSVEIEPTQEEQVIKAPEGYNGFNEVNVKGAKLQQKIVTPSKEIQVIKADDGYYGLSDVIVGVNIDEVREIKEMLTDGANATPNDIKLGKTAYVGGKLITGTYEASGTIDITENGNYDVTDYGTANVNIESTLKKVLDVGKNARYLFYNSDITDINEYLAYEDTRNVERMDYMFAYSKITTFNQPFYTSKVKNTDYMFQNCTNLVNVQIDLSNVYTAIGMFQNLSNNIRTINLTNTLNLQVLANMFYNCYGLRTISGLDMRNVTNTSDMFRDCFYLENLEIFNIKKNLIVGFGGAYGHKLSLESLIDLCQECINVNSSRTLTVGSANIRKLANVYVKLTGEAEEDETLPKIPMVQCESTDDGAMLIKDYMALKSWTLA